MAAPKDDGIVVVNGRTKYKALIKWGNMQFDEVTGKTTELKESDLVGLAAWMKESAGSTVSQPRADRRFPNTNQTNHCWTALNEYQLCVEKRSKDDAMCLQRARDYTTICPDKWVQTWKENSKRGVGMTVNDKFADDDE